MVLSVHPAQTCWLQKRLTNERKRKEVNQERWFTLQTPCFLLPPPPIGHWGLIVAGSYEQLASQAAKFRVFFSPLSSERHLVVGESLCSRFLHSSPTVPRCAGLLQSLLEDADDSVIILLILMAVIIIILAAGLEPPSSTYTEVWGKRLPASPSPLTATPDPQRTLKRGREGGEKKKPVKLQATSTVLSLLLLLLTWCLATMWACWISGGLMEGLYCRGWPRREYCGSPVQEEQRKKERKTKLAKY